MTASRLLIRAALAGIILSAQACSGESEQMEAARNRGITDADDFISLASQKKPSQLAMQSFLLSVRDKERRLRLAGEDHIADTYIQSFETQLRDSVPELLSTISSEK